ncbi:MAG: sulfatase-like hydrolase/transferase [Planctomycetota bacterium]
MTTTSRRACLTDSLCTLLSLFLAISSATLLPVLASDSAPTAAAAKAAATTATAKAARPNVIIVMLDDLGWADLGCYGSKFHRTPRIDQWATTGTRFTQAYAACPVCSPTRAALQTGKWPARLQLTDWLPGRPDRPDQRLKRPELRQQLPLDEVTLAERLQAAGYATAHIGKWHLGGVGFEPTRHGFSLNIACDHTGTPLSYFAPYRAGDRVMPGLEQAPPNEYLTDRLSDEALRFVDQHRDQPFFLHLAHYAVHTPMSAPESSVAEFPAAGPFRGQQNNPTYAAMLAAVDKGFGRIVDRLRELQLTERTIIVFTSDNGGLATTEGPRTPATSNAPLRDGKGFLYEGGIRVPLVFSGPGIRAGETAAFPTSTVDLLPTLLSLCQVADDLPRDGVNLQPTLAGAAQPAREALFWHYPHYANQGSRPGGAIRQGDYKLIEFYETGRHELFQVAADMSETRNLAEQEPDRVKQMAQKLAEWRQSVAAQMPTPHPDYRPHLPDAEGRIVLPARTADVHGVMLRYEPMPHKNTLGFWVRKEDWAEWAIEVTKAGSYELEVHQGCGNGSGGAQVDWSIGDQTVSMTVQETGGFQNFVPRRIGTLKFTQPGRYTLTVKPQTKPGPAVMDVRQVVLHPTTN